MPKTPALPLPDEREPAESIFHESLAALEQTAHSLNSKTDALNTEFTTVEERLTATHIGLEVWHERPIHSWLNGDIWHHAELGFTKLHGAWCLAVREVFERNGEQRVVPDSSIPLAQSSRAERIGALTALPALVAAIDQAGRKAIQAIDDVTQSLRKNA